MQLQLYIYIKDGEEEAAMVRTNMSVYSVVHYLPVLNSLTTFQGHKPLYQNTIP